MEYQIGEVMRKFAYYTIKIIEVPFFLVIICLDWLADQTGA